MDSMADLRVARMTQRRLLVELGMQMARATKEGTKPGIREKIATLNQHIRDFDAVIEARVEPDTAAEKDLFI
jgi:hypothetical protein